jgi:ESS family glutamate:Na+ symporter
LLAAVVVAILLLIGIAIRALVSWLGRARIPASVIAGVVGCAVAQGLLLASGDALDANVQSVLASFRGWAGTLISIVFAGLLLAPSSKVAFRSRDVWQQGIAAWIIILGQLALGLMATALFIRPFYDVPAPFGQFIEVTMAGGFGSANSMANVLESGRYSFLAGRDLLVFGATAGLLWGVVSGLFLARFGEKRGWTTRQDGLDAVSPQPVGNLHKVVDAPIDPIFLQLCFLTVAFGIGMLMQAGVAQAGVWLDGQFDPTLNRYTQNLGNLPLFFFALLGGWVVRVVLQALRCSNHLDRELIHRLCGIAMDVLIVASLSSIAFNQIRAYLWPVVLLLVVGSVWSAFCLIWLSRRLLPARYWFELGLINYGFSTAATAQGMMFLKLVDPKLKSGAAETYALGAPLTAPFIGGGVLTFVVLPPVIDWLGLMPVGMAVTVIIAVLFAVGRKLAQA